MAKYIVNSNPTGSSAIDQYKVTGGKEFQRQLFMANQEQQWNRENTENQRAYDTPLAQMSRFREAGINPYMAMSNITNGSGVAAQGASQQINSSADAAEMSAKYGAAQGFAQLGLDASTTAAQIRNMDSQSQLNEVDAQTRGIENLQRIGFNREQIRGAILGNDFAAKTFDARVQKAESEQSIAQSQAQSAAAQAKIDTFNQQLQEMYGQEAYESNINQIQAITDYYVYQARYTEKNIELLAKQMESEMARTGLYKAQTNEANARADEAESSAQLNRNQVAGYYDAAAQNQREQAFSAQQSTYRENQRHNKTFGITLDLLKGERTLQQQNIMWNPIDRGINVVERGEGIINNRVSTASGFLGSFGRFGFRK